MAEIDLTPTEEMAANAARGLELRRKHGKGGTEIGVARARDISNRKNLSPETVRRMHAFFSRHEKNKAGGEDDAGYIAWMLWSGDAGRDWAKRKVEQMDKGENQRSDTYKEIAQRLGSAAKFANEEAQMRELIGQLGQKPDKVIYKYGAFEMHFYGRAGKGDGEQRARRTLANLHAFMRRTGLDTHGAYYQPIDDRDPSQGGMIVLLASTFDKFSRPGAKAKFAAQFEVGRTYEHAWANDSDSYGFWKVISRSGSMMVVQDVGAGGRVRTSDPQDVRYVATPRAGEQKRVKIHSDDRGEFAYPTGRYSMAPIIRATNPKSSRWSKNDRPGAKAKFAADAREVGQEILRQLGGGRFMSMVGGKNAMYGMFGGKPGLQVSIGKGAEGGINRVIVTLDPATDTYRMEFWKIAKGGMSTQKVSEANMVYADDLQRVFTDRTRFYTSLSRPGAKAKMAAHWTERVEVVEDVSFRNKNTGATVSGGGAVPWRSAADRANWEAITHYSLMDTRTGTTAGKQYRTRQEAERALADAKAQRIRDERRAEREASSPDARRRAATIKEIDRLMATGMTQIEAIQYLKSRGLRIASSRPGAKVANAVREGEKVSASDTAVSRKIRKLMDEGKPQKQAVAIALDLERRGEL